MLSKYKKTEEHLTHTLHDLPCAISSNVFWFIILSRVFIASRVRLVMSDVVSRSFLLISSFCVETTLSFLSFSLSRCCASKSCWYASYIIHCMTCSEKLARGGGMVCVSRFWKRMNLMHLKSTVQKCNSLRQGYFQMLSLQIRMHHQEWCSSTVDTKLLLHT